jgi:uncharacterized protein involved in type VI secretion and phage assembly
MKSCKSLRGFRRIPGTRGLSGLNCYTIRDVLLVESFSASECIFGLFEIDLQLISTLENVGEITAEKLIGAPVTLAVSVFSDFEKGPWRYFNGIVSRFHKILSSEASLRSR